MKSPLNKDGEKFRQILAEHGYEFTPEEVAESIKEAIERCAPPLENICLMCGKEHWEFRFGVCPCCALGSDENTRKLKGG